MISDLSIKAVLGAIINYFQAYMNQPIIAFGVLPGAYQLGKQYRVLYRIFHQRGEIIACGNILKVGGSEGMLPQEDFEIYNL